MPGQRAGAHAQGQREAEEAGQLLDQATSGRKSTGRTDEDFSVLAGVIPPAANRGDGDGEGAGRLLDAEPVHHLEREDAKSLPGV